ncbi:tetratricopeptide repeat protein [Piscinibacter sp.]|jgi:Flp pilus assembly protein TadD|uniref:tetratricopeptide repeat protein n=1 Tax=Piscinibacter sp. TaxID=1903157 RepID=UPI002F3E845C
MSSKSLWTLVLAIALAPVALAAGSTSTSRPPAVQKAQPSDYELGVQAVQARDYQRALTLLQKVAQAEPRNADAWNYIGFSQRQLRHFDQSLAAYQKALALSPNHRGAIEYLGELYLDLGDLDKAREQLAKLQSLCPTGCPERDDLSRAVGAFQATQKKS